MKAAQEAAHLWISDSNQFTRRVVAHDARSRHRSLKRARNKYLCEQERLCARELESVSDEIFRDDCKEEAAGAATAGVASVSILRPSALQLLPQEYTVRGTIETGKFSVVESGISSSRNTTRASLRDA